MKVFKLLSLLLLSFGLFFSGCSHKKIGEPVKIHWDRDTCARCHMLISDRHAAAEIINPDNGTAYKFDDFGCAISWLKEHQPTWRNKAIIWIMNAKTEKWIDARKAYYTVGNTTPMAYGLLAYTKSTIPKGKAVIDFEQAVKHVYLKNETTNN